MKFILLLFLFSIIAAVKSDLEQNKMNQFSLNFYEKAVKRNPGKSFVSSPLSIEILLGLLANGAREESQKEIFEILNLNNLDTIETEFKSTLNRLNNNEGGILKIANKIFLRNGVQFELHPDFKKTANEIFSSDIENVDFSKRTETANIINRWVESKTNNKIKDFIQSDSLNNDVVTLLVNAIYFQGNWKYPFSKYSTYDGKFKINETTEIEHIMMSAREDFAFEVFPELDSKILGLPYKMENTQLLMILPNKIDGLEDLEKKIKMINIKDVLKRLRIGDVDITIPKFKIETTTDLINILEDMGLRKIFDKRQANLMGLLKNPGAKMYVGHASQKAFIEVNERGTEAASATDFGIMLDSIAFRNFYANHPFIYLLVNNDDIIFCGRYIGF